MITQSLQQMLAYVRAGEPELTTRQMALLLVVHERAGPHTVRGLAGYLSVQKPVVTRAIDTLSALGFVTRHRDPVDRRSVYVLLTGEGLEFLRRNGFIEDAKAVAA